MQDVLKEIEEQHDHYTAALKRLQEASVDMTIAEGNLGCVDSDIGNEAARIYKEIKELSITVGEQTKRLRNEHRLESEWLMQPEEVRNAKCSCKAEKTLRRVGTSVWESGVKGVYYAECSRCGKEFNVLWGKHKAVTV